MNDCLTLKPAAPLAPDWEPFRPVQYLGSKLRVLPEIRNAAASLVGGGATVVDLFAGSTVVAQQFAADGALVTAVDTQRYAQIFATALLGIGRRFQEEVDARAIIASALDRAPTVSKLWRNACRTESEALEALDASGLRKQYELLPLAWRSRRSTQACTISTAYAGSYFGVRQALEIDALIAEIHKLSQFGLMSEWQKSAALTALMHAASMAVHSAGKHFAQPLRYRDENAKFLNNRLLLDRSISIVENFTKGCKRLCEVPFDALDRHNAILSSAEDFTARQRGSAGQTLYYLDPPYTAQQYSRFYHVLETIAEGGRPKISAGALTNAGLYPAERFKSAFSSKRLATNALEAVIDSISRSGASALVSYSSSAAGSDGNARMISLESLLAICRRAFGSKNVECSRMRHKYRQFNSAKNSNDKRNDSEILILCKSV